MPILTVNFKPNTSDEWASEQIVALGFVKGVVRSDMRFELISSPDGNFYALVSVPIKDEMKFSNALRLTPRVAEVKKVEISYPVNELA